MPVNEDQMKIWSGPARIVSYPAIPTLTANGAYLDEVGKILMHRNTNISAYSINYLFNLLLGCSTADSVSA